MQFQFVKPQLHLSKNLQDELSSATHTSCSPAIYKLLIIIPLKGRYTYYAHENCPILKTPAPLVLLRPKCFHPLDLGRPISNEPSPLSK